MNVQKGDRAVVIKGASMGRIVKVGNFIAEGERFTMNGKIYLNHDAAWMCVSEGGLLKTNVGKTLVVGGNIIELSRSYRTLEGMEMPLEVAVLRKLVDLDEKPEVYTTKDLNEPIPN
jgi:hypothetical protein